MNIDSLSSDKTPRTATHATAAKSADHASSTYADQQQGTPIDSTAAAAASATAPDHHAAETWNNSAPDNNISAGTRTAVPHTSSHANASSHASNSNSNNYSSSSNSNSNTATNNGGYRLKPHPKKELIETTRHGTSVFPFASYLWIPQEFPYRVTLHWHPETELIRFTKGTFKLSIDMQDMVLHDDAFVLLPGNIIHTIYLPAFCEESAVVFDPRMLLLQNYDEVQSEIFEALLSGNMPLPQVITPDHPAFATIDKLYLYCAHHGATTHASLRLKIKSKLSEILSLYHQYGLISRKNMPVNTKQSKQDKLKELLNYIDSHYAGPMSIKDASSRLGITDQYFCRFFKRITGMSFTAYLNDLRLRRAAKEIELTNRSISDIAYEHGFENAGYFFKSFKLKYGVTPLKYRKRFHSDSEAKSAAKDSQKNEGQTAADGDNETPTRKVTISLPTEPITAFASQSMDNMDELSDWAEYLAEEPTDEQKLFGHFVHQTQWQTYYTSVPASVFEDYNDLRTAKPMEPEDFAEEVNELGDDDQDLAQSQAEAEADDIDADKATYMGDNNDREALKRSYPQPDFTLQNPLMPPLNPQELNYLIYLAKQGRYTFFADPDDNFEELESNYGTTAARRAAALRATREQQKNSRDAHMTDEMRFTTFARAFSNSKNASKHAQAHANANANADANTDTKAQATKSSTSNSTNKSSANKSSVTSHRHSTRDPQSATNSNSEPKVNSSLNNESTTSSWTFDSSITKEYLSPRAKENDGSDATSYQTTPSDPDAIYPDASQLGEDARSPNGGNGRQQARMHQSMRQIPAEAKN